MKYDIAVIGGGPAGYSGALHAAQLGAKVALFENGALGGTCLNVGCIPTKCYVAQAELIERIRSAAAKGIFREAGLFSYKKISEEKDRVVSRLTGGVAALLKAAGVDVFSGRAEISGERKVSCNGGVYEAENILIATGSVNFELPIPGAKGRNVLDSTGLLALRRKPKSIAIIGAGVIGLEFAGVLNALGCEVTAVDVLAEILPGEDRECTQALAAAYRSRGIRLLLGTKVTAIGEDGVMKKVMLQQEDGDVQAISAEYVLISVGRRPVSDVARQAGVELDSRGYVAVDEHMRTSVPHIYAAGDVAGGYLLAHAAYEEAETAVENCLGRERRADLRIMPRCIFTMPSFAAVGLTEEQAREQGEVTTGKFPFAANGKALAGGMEEGFVKWVAEKRTGRLLGCHIIGGEGAELIGAAVVALQKQATAEDFAHMIFPHPTIGESVKEAALDCMGCALHIPRKQTR